MEFIINLIDNRDVLWLRMEHTRLSNRIELHQEILWKINWKDEKDELILKIEIDSKKTKLIKSYLIKS